VIEVLFLNLPGWSRQNHEKPQSWLSVFEPTSLERYRCASPLGNHVVFDDICLIFYLFLLQVRHIQYKFYSRWGSDARSWMLKTNAIWVRITFSQYNSKAIRDACAISTVKVAYPQHENPDVRCNDCAREGSGAACPPETYPATRLHGVICPKILLALFMTLYSVSE
jgi:hypothetical protein